MKKICILSLGLFAIGSLSAQEAVVKEAEKAFKAADSYPAYQEALTVITPAMTNPETSKEAATFWIPGKAGFKIYDDLYAKKSLGQDVNLVEMSNALLDGYNYGMKAIAVDTVVDAKGKVKTKFSKEIANQIVGHQNDYITTAAPAFWDGKDFAKAYEAFQIYLSIPENPALGKVAPAALPDSIVAQTEYNAALAAWQAKMLPESVKSFDRVLEIGYDDPTAYDYAYSVAYEVKDENLKRKYSQIALEKFGTKDPRFLQRLLNCYIDSKEYDKAHEMINKALEQEPENGAYYLSLAVLQEQEDNNAEALVNYKKAVELDPENPYTNLNYGRMLAKKYDEMDQKAVDMPQQEYNKYNYENMRPLLVEATQYFEKCYQLDQEQLDALRYLKNIYYMLNDGDNLKRVEGLLNN